METGRYEDRETGRRVTGTQGDGLHRDRETFLGIKQGPVNYEVNLVNTFFTST